MRPWTPHPPRPGVVGPQAPRSHTKWRHRKLLAGFEGLPRARSAIPGLVRCRFRAPRAWKRPPEDRKTQEIAPERPPFLADWVSDVGCRHLCDSGGPSVPPPPLIGCARLGSFLGSFAVQTRVSSGLTENTSKSALRARIKSFQVAERSSGGCANVPNATLWAAAREFRALSTRERSGRSNG